MSWVVVCAIDSNLFIVQMKGWVLKDIAWISFTQNMSMLLIQELKANYSHNSSMNKTTAKHSFASIHGQTLPSHISSSFKIIFFHKRTSKQFSSWDKLENYEMFSFSFFTYPTLALVVGGKIILFNSFSYVIATDCSARQSTKNRAIYSPRSMRIILKFELVSLNQLSFLLAPLKLNPNPWKFDQNFPCCNRLNLITNNWINKNKVSLTCSQVFFYYFHSSLA